MRGFGYSLELEEINCLKDFADDIKLFLEEYVRVTAFYILGHCMGGGVAMELALLMPWHCRGVILINTINPSGLPGEKVKTVH